MVAKPLGERGAKQRRSERWSLIDLVIYFACVNAGQSPPVIAVLDQRSFSTFEVYLQAIKGASPVAKKGAVVFVAAHSTSIGFVATRKCLVPSAN